MRAQLFFFTLVSCAAREGPPASLSERSDPGLLPAKTVVEAPDEMIVKPLTMSHGERLSRWRTALVELKAGHLSRDARVMVCGRNWTRTVDALRERLEEHLGLGGARWLTNLGHPPREFGSSRRKGKWSTRPGALTTRDGGALIKLELREPFSRIEVLAAAMPHGGSLHIRIDGSYEMQMGTDGSRGTLVDVSRDVPEAPHAVELVATGDGPIDLRGIIVDRQATGVSVFGAKCDLASHVPEASAFLSDVDLWILRVGSKSNIKNYESSLLATGLAWMKRYPSASCLLVRADRKVRLPALAEVEARVADALSCGLADPDEAIAAVVDDPRQLRNAKVREHIAGQLLATDLASVRRSNER